MILLLRQACKLCNCWLRFLFFIFGFKVNEEGSLKWERAIDWNIFVLDGAEKWMTIFEIFARDSQPFSSEDNISFPIALVHQQLSKPWMKYEIIYSTLVILSARTFFVCFMRSMSIKELNELEELKDNKWISPSSDIQISYHKHIFMDIPFNLE